MLNNLGTLGLFAICEVLQGVINISLVCIEALCILEWNIESIAADKSYQIIMNA